MSTTRTGPLVDWKSAGADLWNLTLDTARSKLIDVEMNGDERNVPDYTDMRLNQYPTQTAEGSAGPQMGLFSGNGGGVPQWLPVAGLVLAAGAVVYMMAD